MSLRVAALTALVAGVGVAPAQGFDPAVEASNFSKTQERQALYQSPQGQALLRQVSAQNQAAALALQVSDPDRQFADDLCWNGMDGCAGDARLYDWAAKGYGIVQPLLFTARNGATLSGRVWATKAGPAKRPGIVITNGSVQADEQMYWFAAQALAKAGYVVMTWDPQGQGQSDTRGAAPDADEGFPAQTDGRPFFDGTQDALDFFFSTPEHPYVPRASCTTGTSHAPKQAARVKEGLDAAFNPFWAMFDGRRVGLAGHSYGAAGVSYIGQSDPRVDAIVAWDNLSQPSPGDASGFPPGEKGCPAHPEERVDMKSRIVSGKATPALGMSADYFLPPTPNTADPPDEAHCDAVGAAFEKGTAPSKDDGTNCKSLASKEYSKYGIDTGEIVIRGGSHLDFSFISNPAFGATLRGADQIDWYTTAWFDKYVMGDKTADARLLSDRWRHDGTEADVDPTHDGNTFSFYHPSRLAITRSDGTKAVCENLRAGCAALTAGDGYKGDYDYLALVKSPDTGPTGASVTAVKSPCASRRRITVHLGTPRRGKITRVVATTRGRRVGRSTRSIVTVDLRGLPKGTYAVRLAVTLRYAGSTRHLVVKRRYRTCTPNPG